MSITPWNMLAPTTSPFVEMFELIGVGTAASLVNFVVLTAAASSANSGIYSTSRMLYGLSLIGVAPAFFQRLSKARIPANGLIFSCLCLLLGSAVLIAIPSAMEAFTVVTTIASVLFTFVWSLILFSYIAYAKKYPERRAASKFKLPGGVPMAWATFAFLMFVIALLFLEQITREALLVTPIWFITLAVAYSYVRKRHKRQ